MYHLWRIVIQKGLCVYETHVNEIKWYSSFKCASDYRYPGITQDLYLKKTSSKGA